MKKSALLGIILLSSVLHAYAQQDTQFTQYLFNGLYINPAYAGYKQDLYVQSYFRSQWIGLNGAPKSFAVAIDGTMSENVGLGGVLTNDQIGAQSALSGYLNYAYRIRVGADETSHLSFGLAAGVMQLGIDGSKLNAVTQGDQAIPATSQSQLMPDVNFGMFYANENWFAGLSATNLLAKYIYHNDNPNLLVPVPQPHFYVTGGTLIPINDDVRIKPVMLIKDDLKGPTSIDIDGFILLNQRLNFGAFYRSSVTLYKKSNLQADLPKQNAFGFLAEFFASPSIRIGYSYDHSLENLGTYNYGSHELSIGFYLKKSSDSSSGVRCYKF